MQIGIWQEKSRLQLGMEWKYMNLMIIRKENSMEKMVFLFMLLTI
ncbi:hypothetical protein U724_00340 [Pseudomonas chlororaphis subsp. aurantiaca PB-St2]|nr:hypothetical protein U724_00340 [Pseudomonas chlororaphis subsp. aurantiaca PB-St2]